MKPVSKHLFLPDDTLREWSAQCASSLQIRGTSLIYPTPRDIERGRGLGLHAHGRGSISSTQISNSSLTYKTLGVRAQRLKILSVS